MLLSTGPDINISMSLDRKACYLHKILRTMKTDRKPFSLGDENLNDEECISIQDSRESLEGRELGVKDDLGGTGQG